MVKKQNKKISTKWITVIVLALAAVLVFLSINFFVKQDSVKTHVSQDLKISFQYHKDWYVYDENFDVFITSFPTTHKDGGRPTANQIEISIHNPGGCHKDFEENLKDPACGEGDPSVKPNKIISKESIQKSGGIFYKYAIEYPSEEQQTFYLLQQIGTDKILQISKEPDPSGFEKEFDEIIDSIRFL